MQIVMNYGENCTTSMRLDLLKIIIEMVQDEDLPVEIIIGEKSKDMNGNALVEVILENDEKEEQLVIGMINRAMKKFREVVIQLDESEK
jgi:hypothetical protein